MPALGAGSKVKLTVAHHGPGLVNASPGAISCGAKCSVKLARGTVVKLTAHTRDGSSFDGWSGACTGDDESCTLVVDAPAVAVARFTPAYIPVDVVVGGAGSVVSSPARISCGSGSTACSNAFAKHTHVRLQAQPTEASAFAGWEGACSGVGSCTFTAVNPVSVRAVFRRLYAMSATGTGPGTIESSLWPGCALPCSALSPSSDLVTLSAVPAAGQPFGTWSGACVGAASTCVLATDAATNLSASFGILTLPPPGVGAPLAVTVGGPGVVTGDGGVSCGPTCLVRPGLATTLTATPAAGAAFARWGGDCSGTTPTCALAMTAARSVTATFRHRYALTVSGGVQLAPVGTTCKAACHVSLSSDQVVTLSARNPTDPDVTAAFDWRPVCTGRANVCSFALDAPATVAVKESLVAPVTSTAFGLLVSIAAKGTVQGPGGFVCVRKAGPKACSKSYANGTHVTLHAKPTARFLSWSGSCSGKQPTCALTMDGTKVVIARFKP